MRPTCHRHGARHMHHEYADRAGMKLNWVYEFASALPITPPSTPGALSCKGSSAHVVLLGTSHAPPEAKGHCLAPVLPTVTLSIVPPPSSQHR